MTLMAKKKSSPFEKLSPILVIVSIGLAFAVGVLWQKVENLSGGGTRPTTTTTAQAPSGDTAAPPSQGPSLGKLSEENASRVPEVTNDDHIRGNKNAKVTLIEYSDFECPFCGRFHPTAEQVLEEYGDDVAWVYRHFPLDSIHPKARPAALASECIAELGGEDAFWEFADSVFGDQTQLNDLPALASSVGVNQNSFESCLDSDKYADVVEQDYQGGIGAGVTGTPGNFIVTEDGDTWFVPGAYPFEQITPYIDEALAG